MTIRTVQEILQQEIASLADEQARKALAFVRFLKADEAEEAFLWRQVEEARRHRAEHPEETVTGSAEDFESATAHLREPR